MPSPFDSQESMPKKKMQKVDTSIPTKQEIAKCCFTFLKFDTNYFKRMWKWSKFIESYCANNTTNESDMYRLICNHILALLTNMTNAQVKQLNQNIPFKVQIEFEIETTSKIDDDLFDGTQETLNENSQMKWKFDNELLTNVEGIMLPIFDTANYQFFNKTDDGNQIVMVDSARLNLRCISIGIAAGKAICLSGPVGCGKTTLVEYLAHRTGRIPPKFADIEHITRKETKENSTSNLNDDTSKIGATKKLKRKSNQIESEVGTTVDVDNEFTKLLERTTPANGFLRIQLGDQTDSKMLLGQYRCTDVPGEFVWQAGVLTQAVMNGYWLLLEDLDSCTQDVCMLLTNLLENNFLTVPGFRDCIQISTGFQLFITLRYVYQFIISELKSIHEMTFILKTFFYF